MTYFIVCLTLVVWNPLPVAQGRVDDDIIDCNATVIGGNGQLVANAHLGAFEMGEKVRVRVHLKNPPDDFGFESIRTSCSCLEVQANSNVIPANGELVVFVGLTVPSKSQGSQYMSQITFPGRDGGTELRLNLQFQITNLACFLHKMALHEVYDSSPNQELVVPMVKADKIRLNDIEVKGQGDFDEAKIELRNVDIGGRRRPAAIVSLDREIAPIGRLDGKLQLFLEGQVTDEIQVSMHRKADCSVAPELATVRKVAESEDRYKAHFIIRVLDEDKKKPNDEDELFGETEKLMDPVVKCFAGGKRVDVKAIPISRNAIRVQIEFSRKSYWDESKQVYFFPSELEWEVTHASGSWKVSSELQGSFEGE